MTAYSISFKLVLTKQMFVFDPAANTLWKYQPGIYLFKVNKRNTRKICEICSKLTIKTRHENSLYLTLNRFHTLFWCFYCWLWTSKCRLSYICNCNQNVSVLWPYNISQYCLIFNTVQTFMIWQLQFFRKILK